MRHRRTISKKSLFQTAGFIKKENGSFPNTSSAAPQMRRYVHPIVPAAPRQDGACPALQDVLCALAGQNQVLCAMKSELDEILALLQSQAENGAS